MAGGVLDLLATIQGRDAHGYYEVRCRDPKTGRITKREWFHSDDRYGCAWHMRKWSDDLDVYVGAALRAHRGGGGKADILRAWCLWVDCDTGEAVHKLAEFTPAPSLVILSGTRTNVHAYWSLSHPVAPSWLERANRRLAHALSADVKCANVDRILRPPGTLNHKHDPPVRVSVSSGCGGVYTASEVVGALSDPGPLKPARSTRAFAGSDDLANIPAEQYYAVLTGWEPSLASHVRCPFWDHRSNPAMMLYAGGTFNCFACDVGGNVYTFAAHLWDYQLPVRGDDFKALKGRLTDALK